MKKNVISYLSLLVLAFLSSCNSPELNGHYHLEWGNRTSFQTWNIKNNRMRINDSVCSNKKEVCFGMPIKFKGDSIFVPWVDITYKAKYSIDEKGKIIMTTNYDGKHDTLILTPKENCLNSTDYFNQKTKKLNNSFDLVSLYYNTHGYSTFPIDAKNELIIGKKEDLPFYILNNKILNYSNGKFNIERPTNSNDIWIAIDNKVKLKEVLPIVKELREKGYNIYFSSKEETENNEQIIVFRKSIISINKNGNSIIVNSCEYCEKHPNKEFKQTIKATVFEKDSVEFNNKKTDFFQLRNHIVRTLVKNRTSRLNTEIELIINSNILFENYLELLADLDFVNSTLLGTYYRDKNDPDFKEILDKQNSFNRTNLRQEFPIRIKEIIKTF